MPYVERDGARLYYEDTGGEGPPCAFSHGLLMDHEMFAPQIEALGAAYRCISWDERAHGRTESSGPFTYWDSARDLFAILDRCEIGSAFLVGMSQGGFLSLRAALLEPERVDGLFLIDTQAGVEDPEVVPIYEGMVENWVAHGPSENVEQATAGIILGDMDATPWIQKWRVLPPDYVEAIFETLVGREDLHDRLGEIGCPALVVHGDADMAIPVEKAEALCEGLAACEGVVIVPGGSHTSNLTHPKEVTEALLDFLARHA